MATPPMPGHPHPRFGIGAIPIRGITLRYPNARFRGDNLFSNERGMPFGPQANRKSLPLTSRLADLRALSAALDLNSA
jgi:hypothetical protein